MLSKILRVLAWLFASCVSAVLATIIWSWHHRTADINPSDAVAIANTYIVFTTLIFVGVTVLLAVAGYIFTQHFSTTKGDRERELLCELREKLKTDEALGVKVVDAIFENPDTNRYLRELLGNKWEQLLAQQMTDAANNAQRVAQAAGLARDLR